MLSGFLSKQDTKLAVCISSVKRLIQHGLLLIQCSYEMSAWGIKTMTCKNLLLDDT